MTLLRFSVYFLGFASLVACSAIVLQFFLAGQPVLSPYFWLLFVVIAITTFVAYLLSDLGIRRGGELSIFSLIGGLFLKLFGCLAVVAILIIKYPENKMLTAINFFSLYFLFTVFEVICLLRNLRDQNQT
ncbi:hypothetical protein GCM10007415_17320 [Parapedobacter pyrenivorans]|uniref:Uncharacterized protein n=1 Tax=Parapedobacter pyrenivorans TaxID=1305674 RepID=A0A917HP55_9SPHI|nr:hypothetical protein [Parapedobacter pyrenivorans]GGG84637.1 hypothetical protein GCM10007415_17320 [Parapedobacter pyrenivorans]